MVSLSESHLVLLFCAPTSNTPSNAMAQGAPATAVMPPPRSAPLLHGIASTHSSCVEQPVQRLFFALAARENCRVYGGDAQDAHAHSPLPETPKFVSIDDAHADWYEHRFNKKLDRSLVLLVLHALQGHPASGKLWEKHITAILRSPQFGFKSTTFHLLGNL